MGNVQSEPSTSGGSRKEQASDRASDSRRTSLVESEGTPPSPAMRLARGLGVWFPGSSAPPGLLVPPEPQASPATLPLTLDLPSPVTPPSEAAAAAAVSTPPPPPVGTLLPAPSKWRKPTGPPVTRIRGLLEASHRGQGDPPSIRPRPPTPRPLSLEDPNFAPRVLSLTPPPLELQKPPPPPPPPPPSDRQIPELRTAPALATPARAPAEGQQAAPGAEIPTAGGPRRGAPPLAGEGEMARAAASESGLSLLCKVTFKSGTPLPPAAASSSSAAKSSLGGAGAGGHFAATSGAISYAEVLKQGPLAPGAARSSGEAPRGAQEAEGGDGDGEGCSGPPSAPASRTLPPPPYTTFPGSKPKFEWVSPPEADRHFRFNGAGRGAGVPRRRATALSGPWGSPPPLPGRMLPASASRRPAPSLLAPPMFIFPAPTNGEPVSSGAHGPQDLPPPPPTPPSAQLPAPPSAPQPPELQPTPLLGPPAPTPGPGHLELGLAPAPAPALLLASAADQAQAQAQTPAQVPTPVPVQAPASAPAAVAAAAPEPVTALTPNVAEPQAPAAAPKSRTRRNKGSRAARAAAREDGAPGDGPRGRTAATEDGGGGGAPTAGTAKAGATRHWPPFQVLNSCPCKCYCRHQPRHRRLPRNVSAWLSTPTNHLSEPPWVATIKLAGSLVAGLEHYDLQATHSN